MKFAITPLIALTWLALGASAVGEQNMEFGSAPLMLFNPILEHQTKSS